MIPTADDITAAHEYAISKLCTEIPNNFGAAGRTRWDDRKKECKITEFGCTPTILNPISQPMYTSGGDYMEYKDDHRVFGKFWKKMPPGYYQWKSTKNSGRQKVCARGNFLLWQWCERPESRAEGHQPGITNTPRFQYNIRNGKEECYITKEYCDDKGVSFDAAKRDCYVSQSQKILEFFTGSVFVRSRRRKSDKRLKDNIIPIRYDFPIKGVHVYTFEWNDTAKLLYGLEGHDIGFIADELDPKYVSKDENGYKVIDTTINDDYMKKLTDFLNIKDQIKYRLKL